MTADLVVVGVDGSPGAASALRWAAREATLHGWALRAVLAWGVADQRHALPDEWFEPGCGEADAAEALDAAMVAALGPDAAAGVDRRLVCDLPAHGLIAAAAGARLLVVGARGLGGVGRLLLGSVSEHCLHHATTPVAIVHGDPPGVAPFPTPRVVVGVDGPRADPGTLRWAVEEARARRAALEVVHAWRPPFLAGYPFGPLAAEGADLFEDAARQVLDDALAHADLSGLHRPVERALVCGSAASAVLEAAEGADLVVVGTHGTGVFRGLLAGSVSDRVARRGPCPVVVVRSTEPGPGPAEVIRLAGGAGG